MPIIKEAGNENITNNPARVVRGLPQPGLSIIITPITRAAVTSNFIAIFPNRILTFSEKANKVFYTISLSAVVESVNREIF